MSAKIVTVGIIAAVLDALPLNKVVDTVCKKIDKMVNGDVANDTIVYFNVTVSDILDVENWWEDTFIVNNITAAYLEKKTMDIANPYLSTIPGLGQDDLAEVCRATDELQVEAVKRILSRCKEKYTPPQVVRVSAQMGVDPNAKYLF